MRTSFLLVGLVTLVPACPLLNVQADVQEVCLTYRGVTIAGIPVGGSISQSFDFDDLQGAKALADADAQLTFTHAEVRATSGVPNFSFVQHAELSIASGDASSTLPTLSIFNCDACGNDTATLDVANATSSQVQDYIKTGSLVVTIDFTGTPPATDWTADVDICMTGTVNYTVSQ